MNGVDIAGNYAYLAAGNAGLLVVDITNPEKPIEAGFSETLGNPYYVEVANGYAYVLGIFRLEIIDVNDPEKPVRVGAAGSFGANTHGLAVSGKNAYIGVGSPGLYIVDIEEPTNPQVAGFYDTHGLAQGSDIVSDRIYLADGLGGVLILRVSGITPPNKGFLEFPIDYSDSDFATVAGLFQIEGGKIITRVDHDRTGNRYTAADGVGRTITPPPDDPTWKHYNHCRDTKHNACYDQADAPDIVVDSGTPILAAFAGKVVGLVPDCTEGGQKSCSGFGNYVLLDHANCYRTRYSHLNTTSVVYGQTVSTGKMVGLAGSTGKSTGPHLDFQVRFDPSCKDGKWLEVLLG